METMLWPFPVAGWIKPPISFTRFVSRQVVRMTATILNRLTQFTVTTRETSPTSPKRPCQV